MAINFERCPIQNGHLAAILEFSGQWYAYIPLGLHEWHGMAQVQSKYENTHHKSHQIFLGQYMVYRQ